MSYHEIALEIARRRLSSMDRNERRAACSGGYSVAKQALLGMLGSSKFLPKRLVSQAEANREDALSALEQAGGDLNAASARLGITKSSLKRKILAPSETPAAYDEANLSNPSRRYLENNYGSWTVLDFDPRSSRACLEMRSASGKVTISVDVPRQF